MMSDPSESGIVTTALCPLTVKQTVTGETIMPYGKGTYGSKVGRPSKKNKPKAKPKMKKKK